MATGKTVAAGGGPNLRARATASSSPPWPSAVIELLRPLREKSLGLLKDRAYLEDVMAKGAQKARDITDAKVMDIYDRLGFVRRR